MLRRTTRTKATNNHNNRKMDNTTADTLGSPLTDFPPHHHKDHAAPAARMPPPPPPLVVVDDAAKDGDSAPPTLSPLDHQPITDQEYWLAPLLWPRSVPDKVHRWITYLGTTVAPELLTWSPESYRQLCSDLLADPARPPPPTMGPATSSSDHPLSQSTESTWSRFFDQQQLHTLIGKDVPRTFPDHAFFEAPEVQAALAEILAVHSLHRNMPYRQGMHEVAAVLYWLVDAEKLPGTNVVTEADRRALTFWLYDAVMRIHGWIYERDVASKLSHRFLHVYLRAIDAELYDHLVGLQVEPHLFGLRWLRVLFAREFPALETVTSLWDGLFCMLWAHRAGIAGHPAAAARPLATAQVVSSDAAVSAWCEHLCYVAVSVLVAARPRFLLDDYGAVMAAAMRYESPLTGPDIVLQAVRFRRRFQPVVDDLDRRTTGPSAASITAGAAWASSVVGSRGSLTDSLNRSSAAGGGGATPSPPPVPSSSSASAIPATTRPRRASAPLVPTTATTPASAFAAMAANDSTAAPGPGAAAGVAAVQKAARGAIRALTAALAASGGGMGGGAAAATAAGGPIVDELRPVGHGGGATSTTYTGGAEIVRGPGPL
ncbi:rab-GTPase-TBC domain-containing protein [Blastocladiella britannica]|nr:rab-GTPase-TBC domain-containing protein [Blastocladiella britannica]